MTICDRCGFDCTELEKLLPRYCIKCGEKLEQEKKQENETLTIDEVSALLRLTKGSIYQYVRRGIIPAYKIGKILRFDKKEIESLRRHGGN